MTGRVVVITGLVVVMTGFVVVTITGFVVVTVTGPVVVTTGGVIVFCVVVMTGRVVVVGISFPHCFGSTHVGHEIGAGHVFSTALPHSFLSHLN